MTGARARDGWTIRQHSSGRWQATIRDPATGRRISLGTHPNAQDGEQAALVDQRRGSWHDPRKGAVPPAEHLGSWLARKTATGQHGARYAAEAARLVRLHINPRLGPAPVGQLTPPAVRAWYQHLQADRIAATGEVGLVPAKTYRILRAALADAVRDELIPRNHADIPGAGVERSDERPLPELDQLHALVDAAPDRRKALLLLAMWGGLR